MHGEHGVRVFFIFFHAAFPRRHAVLLPAGLFQYHAHSLSIIESGSIEMQPFEGRLLAFHYPSTTKSLLSSSTHPTFEPSQNTFYF